jgi:type I restriction enzyme S subunit
MSSGMLVVADYDAGTEDEPKYTSLPPGWAWAKLREVGIWGSGGTPASNNPDFYDGNIPWYRITDLNGGRLPQPEKTISELGLSSSSARLIEPPFLLLAMYGASIGKTGISTIQAATNQAIAWCRPQHDIDLDFLHFYLRHIQRSLVDQGQGGAQPNISRSIVLDQPIPLAPAAEQRRIVARIDELFAEIAEGEAALERARQGLDTWRRALLKAAVTGELTRNWREANHPSETGADLLARIHADRALSANHSRGRRAGAAEPLITSKLPQLPEGWVWARLQELGEVSGGLTKYPDREGFPHKLPYLRVANVQMGRLDLTEVTEIGVRPEERGRLLLGQNDLLIVEGNGSINQIGRCALWNDEIRPCVHQNHIIKVRFSEPALSSWASRWLLSPSGRAAIKDVASSTSGLHTLSISKIQNLPIPVPPLQEAHVALAVLEESLAAASEAEDECEKLMRDRIALRQSILKAGFEGRLVPQDPTDEPASELLARLRNNFRSNGARPRRARATADFFNPSLPGLTWPDPAIRGPAGRARG